MTPCPSPKALEKNSFFLIFILAIKSIFVFQVVMSSIDNNKTMATRPRQFQERAPAYPYPSVKNPGNIYLI